MVFDEKVLTALEVLTDAAENDFELFRICNLVRDLVTPPKVEVIDEKHHRFNGSIYYKDKTGHYRKSEGIHRDIWRYYNGDTPADYDVHHVNENPADNSLENLVLLTQKEHMQIHARGGINRKEPITFTCLNCGKTVTTFECAKTKFCSKKCINSYYNHHHEPVHKICEHCGKEFVLEGQSAVYASRRRFCSRACFAALRREIRTCPVCGKTFEMQKSSVKKCCSRSCALKLWHAQKKQS